MTAKRFLLLPLVLIFAAPSVFSAEELLPFPPEAIFVATYLGQAELVREILAAGVDTDYRNGFGDTVLHVAMFQSNLMVVRLLLDYGFDPNATIPRSGSTPLHNAVSANNVHAARLLLQHGANRFIRDRNGRTALDIARLEEKRDLVFLLLYDR